DLLRRTLRAFHLAHGLLREDGRKITFDHGGQVAGSRQAKPIAEAKGFSESERGRLRQTHGISLRKATGKGRLFLDCMTLPDSGMPKPLTLASAFSIVGTPRRMKPRSPCVERLHKYDETPGNHLRPEGIAALAEAGESGRRQPWRGDPA